MLRKRYYSVLFAARLQIIVFIILFLSNCGSTGNDELSIIYFSNVRKIIVNGMAEDGTIKIIIGYKNAGLNDGLKFKAYIENTEEEFQNSIDIYYLCTDPFSPPYTAYSTLYQTTTVYPTLTITMKDL